MVALQGTSSPMEVPGSGQLPLWPRDIALHPLRHFHLTDQVMRDIRGDRGGREGVAATAATSIMETVHRQS